MRGGGRSDDAVMARAAHHSTFALRRGLKASRCRGFVRRIYVRPGGRGAYSTAVGWYCDGCAETWIDPGHADEVGRMVDLARGARHKRANATTSDVGVARERVRPLKSTAQRVSRAA